MDGGESTKATGRCIKYGANTCKTLFLISLSEWIMNAIILSLDWKLFYITLMSVFHVQQLRIAKSAKGHPLEAV